MALRRALAVLALVLLQAEAQETPRPGGSCRACHAGIVDEYLRHGMSDSLGPETDSLEGSVAAGGSRYDLRQKVGGGVCLTTKIDDGREQGFELVGRIGAGILSTSWIARPAWAGACPTPVPLGAGIDRLYFAPVEEVTGYGLRLAPFAAFGPGATGLDLPLTADCLSCHTSDAVPAAFPRHQLGSELARTVGPIDCSGCHGPAGRHVELMTGDTEEEDIGLPRLSRLDPGAQRDVCARCHLEGEAHLDLTQPGAATLSLLARRPALVTASGGDDFRFVGQLERLALSACFRGTESMTCTSCHLPHAGVRQQGTADFDRRCQGCHAGPSQACTREAGLSVEQAAGTPRRTVDGCVDCHVRRSQPYDVPHLRVADHLVRRHIPPPATAAPRPFDDPARDLTAFDDGRLSEALASPGGRRWLEGLRALGRVRHERWAAAQEIFATFPEPGDPEARRPTTPPGLPALETSAAFHFERARALEAVADAAGARRAYEDALALDPDHVEARLNRASLALSSGDLATGLDDASLVLRRHPAADAAWNLRARAAALAGNLGSALEALRQSQALWPLGAGAWHEGGRLSLRLGDREGALHQLRTAERLEPRRPGLAEDLAAAAD